MVKYSITPDTVPGSGIMFADHESEHRSGHLSHALVEYAPGCVLAFYSDCSYDNCQGHNGYGWIDYRRSTDGARTWDAPCHLDYSLKVYNEGRFTVSCEKAVSVKENEIVLFCTRNTNPNGWAPYYTPVWLKSCDGGKSWKEMGQLSEYCGRIFDAITVEGVIYVLHFCNSGEKSFDINSPEQTYRIYRSDDGGESFQLQGEFPNEDLQRRAYGAMEILPDGRLICYVYNYNDEFNLDTFISSDFGKTWDERGKAYFAKRIRNPQIAKVHGGYILHGRSGSITRDMPIDLVLYTSEDAIHWDEGRYIGHVDQYLDWSACAYYSNNLVLNEGDRQRVLIQSSVSYYAGETNVAHWYLDIE